MIASPASNHGKTLVTIALAKILKNIGLSVALAKSGPDFIDHSYHLSIENHNSLNLDPWAMNHTTLHYLMSILAKSDMTLIEAANGLFDGALDLSASSADIASLFNIPVILVVNVKATGASILPLVSGFANHKKNVNIVAIILNNVASENHKYILLQSLKHTNIPILASIPRNNKLSIPSQHLGLTHPEKHKKIINQWTQFVSKHIDKKLLTSLFSKPNISQIIPNSPTNTPIIGQNVAIAYDKAFSFVYNHLLLTWKQLGVSFSFFSPLNNETPDPLAQTIFLPGGYPELYLEKLSNSPQFINSIKNAPNKGINIYAECGGFMILGAKIQDKNGKYYPMCNLLPHSTSFLNPKLHLGYRNIKLLQDSFIGEKNKSFKGHCFHYTSSTPEQKPNLFATSNALNQNTGIEGFQVGNVAGSYQHIVSA